jgi:hypothetical protein
MMLPSKRPASEVTAEAPAPKKRRGRPPKNPPAELQAASSAADVTATNDSEPAAEAATSGPSATDVVAPVKRGRGRPPGKTKTAA